MTISTRQQYAHVRVCSLHITEVKHLHRPHQADILITKSNARSPCILTKRVKKKNEGSRSASSIRKKKEKTWQLLVKKDKESRDGRDGLVRNRLRLGLLGLHLRLDLGLEHVVKDGPHLDLLVARVLHLAHLLLHEGHLPAKVLVRLLETLRNQNVERNHHLLALR